MRIRTITANILLPTGIALATAIGWVWVTGDPTPPVLTVVGLALFAAGLAAVADWTGRQAVHAYRRRSRPSRHRKPGPSRPLAERANPLPAEMTATEGEA